ncbi:DDE-type integrase/transposase/recombinase [Pseudomonas wadenswilerensis]|uniref:Transposase for transposon Tn552 n=1 Tax=Pseudomonas wadenswilerensis TaxID=1785161 RepID=A0A380T3U5_9PSED|nr:DDE-type integrase/transposase/recombinase [Pseudomonas wadenswilerensis]SUQ64196.1 Transposase for transposon Tn552 [Pseudomonas wadenswilerensis]
MNTKINNNDEFSPIVGEHYEYNGQAYEVMEIVAERYQLRSLERAATITFHSFNSLRKAWVKGRFVCVHEAPLNGESNKIIAGLNQVELDLFQRRQAYVNAVIENLGGPRPINKVKSIIAKTAEKINDPRAPCYNTVHNWIKLFFRSNGNPLSLVTRSIRRKTPRMLHQPFPIQEIIEHHLNTYFLVRTPFSGTDIIDQIQSAVEVTNTGRLVNAPLPIPSASTLRRIMKEHDEYERLHAQRGHKEAGKTHHWSRKQMQPVTLLECAEADSVNLDIILVDANGEPCGRPWLTALMNCPSRRLLGYKFSINAPCLEMTMSTLKHSLDVNRSRTGLCRTYIFDNGSEFTTEKTKIILATLGSTPIFCEPGEPNQKPHIERFFRTLNEQLIHHMRGTTFSDPNHKGDYDSTKQAMYTIEQLEHIFEDWLENVYHQTYHREIGTSPNDYWDTHVDNLFPPHQFSETTLKQLFLCRESSFAVNGRVGFKKLQWTCPSVPFLNHWRDKRKKLTIYYDVSDLGYAFVCHPDNPDDLHRVFAVNPDYQEGLTLSEHCKIMAQVKERKLAFNDKIALMHRLRINESIAKQNKHKPKNKSKFSGQAPEGSRADKLPRKLGIFSAADWLTTVELPDLTETCLPPPSTEENDS